MNEKQQLRRQLRRVRAAVPELHRRQSSLAVTRHAARLLGRGKRLGVYLAAGSELDLEDLMSTALHRHARLYLPVIPPRGRRLWFAKLQGEARRWYRNRYGILEYHGPRLRAERLDVLFIPLVGVDRHGYRLGQGGGYYDATLAFRRLRRAGRPLLVGVAYECQRVDEVPREPWDMPLDLLLTEAGLHRFSAPRPG